MEEVDHDNGWMPGLRPVLALGVAYLVVQLLNWWAGGARPW